MLSENIDLRTLDMDSFVSRLTAPQVRSVAPKHNQKFDITFCELFQSTEKSIRFAKADSGRPSVCWIDCEIGWKIRCISMDYTCSTVHWCIAKKRENIKIDCKNNCVFLHWGSCKAKWNTFRPRIQRSDATNKRISVSGDSSRCATRTHRGDFMRHIFWQDFKTSRDTSERSRRLRANHCEIFVNWWCEHQHTNDESYYTLWQHSCARQTYTTVLLKSSNCPRDNHDHHRCEKHQNEYKGTGFGL